MAATRGFTAIIEREGDGYAALCPELDVASQGDTVDEARSNLAEAATLFLEAAAPAEVDQRLKTPIAPDHPELRTGALRSVIRQSGLPRSLFESD